MGYIYASLYIETWETRGSLKRQNILQTKYFAIVGMLQIYYSRV